MPLPKPFRDDRPNIPAICRVRVSALMIQGKYLYAEPGETPLMKKKYRSNILALSVVLGLLWSVAGQTPALARNQNKVKASLSVQNDNLSLPTDQVIIKYKAGTDAFLAPTIEHQMQRLDNAGGVHLRYFRAMSNGSQVLKLPSRSPLQQVYDLANKLENLPEVEYAEPDRLLQPALTPNDPQYGSQWDLWDTWGINAPTAWDITTGSSSVVVADVDTGITNHVDLSGRTVPGYDFINNAQIANDGNGRDSDPSDPGDWVTFAESNNPSSIFYGCSVDDSSWHGTHTAGTIGAAGNNSTGITGINWTSKILPIRVLGKCGGYNSDIVDGMRWAAGLSVPGVPPNPNPAKVLNLSLGGMGTCSTSFQTAIDQITAAGAVVVVAAGNSGSDAGDFEPANCNNVISVAATGQSGSLAYYSNYGPSVKVSAPGGDMTIDTGILSTINTGATVPVSDTYGYYQGTSMATPHVTGVVSLMFSLDPALTPSQVLQIIQSTAKAFPGGSTCDTAICGAGIVDAGAAIQAVLELTGVSISGNVGTAGVVLSYTDGGLKTAISQSDGSYTVTVPYGWSGTVTPSDVCFTFNPTNRSYSNLTANQIVQDYTSTPSSNCADIDVVIGGNTLGLYRIKSNQVAVKSFVNLLTGPVRIVSTNGQPFFTSQRVTSGDSYNELLGVPPSQFTTEYWFPYYDHGYPNIPGDMMRTWVLVGNPDPAQTASVDIYIGGVKQPGSPFSIPPGGNITPRWIGTIGSGPVRVVSTNGVNIFASERVFTVPNDSFNEVFGYPASQFTTEYWFPWYDSINMQNFVLVGNTSSSQSANVDIFIGSRLMGSYAIQPNQTLKRSYAGVMDGPVRVVSTNGVNIVTSQSALSGSSNSFNEVMGYPFDRFDTEYWFPYYDHGYPNVPGNMMRTWILVGNPSGTTTANVEIFIAGVSQGTYAIPPGSRITPRWIGTINGPVRVVSDIPVFASERVFTVPNNVFNEMMGYPASQLSAEYWFPWYDSVNMKNDILISKP